MKGIPERAINKSRDGDLRLYPTLWDRFTNYGFCILFAFMGTGLFLRGIFLVREGGEGGFWFTWYSVNQAVRSEPWLFKDFS
jgi:hypothetical protein